MQKKYSTSFSASMQMHFFHAKTHEEFWKSVLFALEQIEIYHWNEAEWIRHEHARDAYAKLDALSLTLEKTLPKNSYFRLSVVYREKEC